ncbi:CAP domain-containing protein [Halalkalibacterium ligniniphilum]|uniref:CAP domain-containing protein n=1 Tax=Halalkalibacterium ligniniphilum TaxID=1134413 RepID=UPI000347845A|nr:CAP domain-containing protein [Halalkalibacterium ligniniphilum]
MKRLGCITFIVLFVLSVLFIEQFYMDDLPFHLDGRVIEGEPAQGERVPMAESVNDGKEDGGQLVASFEQGELFIGMTAEQVTAELGEPARIDPSAYLYQWWVYPISDKAYVQIGIQDDEVVTIFMTGEELTIDSLSLGQSYEDIAALFPFEANVSFDHNGSSYQYHLTEQDVKARPLVKNGEVWAQLYFDTFTNELSSIRLLTTETLLHHQPYNLTYRGQAPEKIEPTEDEWSEIEVGQARQIFDLTNIIRIRHGIQPLQWNADAAEVAFHHSKDMAEENYFSHTSPLYGELSDRFVARDIQFMQIGENIAAQYVDGAEAVEGWLNSEGHRVNLLSEDYSHLGVGVFEKHYTQNFMLPLP